MTDHFLKQVGVDRVLSGSRIILLWSLWAVAAMVGSFAVI